MNLAGGHQFVDRGSVMVVVVGMVMVMVGRSRSSWEAEAQLMMLLREGRRRVEGVLA